jgi:hypothetical protein
MLIELLTPMMLATQPLSIDLPPSSYDHQAQMSTVVAMTNCTATINGTQTFGANGQPSDHDGDNDAC